MVATTFQRPEKFGIGRVFSNSFAVIGRNAGLCIGLAAIFSAAPTLILQVWTMKSVAEMQAQEPSVVVMNSLFSIAIGLISFLLSLLLQASLVRATIEDLNGKQPSFGDCINTAVRLLLPTLAIGLLVGLGVGLGFILLIVPGIILLLRWSVSVPVLVQERLGVFGSMARSAVLTKGSRWGLLGLFLVLTIVTVALQMALSAVVLLAWMGSGLVGAFVSTLVTSISSIILSVATAVAYVELRLVKEGTSVDELAEIFS